LDRGAEKSTKLLANVELVGCATQCHTARINDEREVVLGLDFGTSSVKVVIGDSALGKAFAVPYCKAVGIKSFLLPSRLYQEALIFSVEAGTHVFRDLKLRFSRSRMIKYCKYASSHFLLCRLGVLADGYSTSIPASTRRLR